MITIEVNGKNYAGFYSARVDLILDQLSNQFAFEASSEKGRPLPFLGGERCRVRVDGEPVITGTIEVVNPSGDEGSHRITLLGRDLTSDLIVSQIAAMDDLRPPITLREIVEAVITHIDSPLEVVDRINVAPFNEAEDLIAPEPGDVAFEFLSKYARKRQALLSSDGLGRVVITRSSGSPSGGSIIHRPEGDSRNNVLRYSGRYDRSDLFRVYKSAGQLNPLASLLANIVDKDTISDQPAEVVDESIPRGRQYVMTDDSLTSSGEAIETLKWELNVRRARAREQTFTVAGFRDQAGELWDVNRLVRVDSPFVGIDSTMLVNRVSFSYTEGQGSDTMLVVVPRDAFTIALGRPVKEEETGLGLALPS